MVIKKILNKKKKNKKIFVVISIIGLVFWIVGLILLFISVVDVTKLMWGNFKTSEEGLRLYNEEINFVWIGLSIWVILFIIFVIVNKIKKYS